MYPIILASTSSRRKELLELINLSVDQYEDPEIEEVPLKQELPRLFCIRMAEEKSLAIAKKFPNSIIVAGDNVVACGRRILDKALTNEDVRISLKLLSGRRHTVFSTLSIRHPDGRKSTKIDVSKVSFKRLTSQEIDNYISSGEGLGKAGGYAIQGLAAQYIKWMQGSYHSVMGLPIHQLYQVLSGWKNLKLLK
jgi:septum formation protein